MKSTQENVAQTDVLVIGAGPAGAALALKTALSGLRVRILEQGGSIDATLRERSQQSHELLAAADFAPTEKLRQAAADYPVDDTDSDMRPLMWNGLGGSAALYAGAYPRLKPSDFRVRSLDGVADDWPLDYEELAPHYTESERLFGVAGLSGNPAYPPREEFPRNPLPIRKIGERISEAHDRLGWHWWPSTSATLGRAFDGIANCTVHAECPNSCPERTDKQSCHGILQRARAAGAEVTDNARVCRILTESGKAVGAEYLDAFGNLHTAYAKTVVIAANGLGTARLLLLSGGSAQPEGLANSSGLVGKNLMFHPFAVVSGTFPERVDGIETNYENAINSHEFYETDISRGFVRGSNWALCSAGGPLRTALALNTWGPEHSPTFSNTFGHGAFWAIFGEDLPEESNHVTLDPTARDSSGIPGVKVTYKFSENSRRLIEYSAEKAAQSLAEAGASDVQQFLFVRDAGWHLLGTARMGTDPDRSVVNPWGETHDVENLFIADGSVFVTAGAVNPTNTIVALALRTADHIVERLHAQKEEHHEAVAI
ncbi:GMC family oxidoreductase [Pseudarthrobacter sp. NPDC058362]|uniref:GMC family oxidoreductase n=1 Tax=Pseudarthrobacter sp. NPDC058362 TaxID=3346458 RepID=UPI00365D206E